MRKITYKPQRKWVAFVAFLIGGALGEWSGVRFEARTAIRRLQSEVNACANENAALERALAGH